MYGKIIDGKLILAPNPMVVGKRKIYNPKPEQYVENGYLEIIETDYPDDNKYYEKQYIEQDGVIRGIWVETEAPEFPTVVPTLEERTTALEQALNMILEGVTE